MLQCKSKEKLWLQEMCVTNNRKAKISLHDNDLRLSSVMDLNLGRKHAVAVAHHHITPNERAPRSEFTLKKSTKERENSVSTHGKLEIQFVARRKLSYADGQMSPLPKVFEYSVGRHSQCSPLAASKGYVRAHSNHTTSGHHSP